jgi:hypothetical protein
MKKTSLLILIVLMTASLSGLTGEIEYLEGTVDIKGGSGELEWADFGMEVSEGDTIITGEDGFCEVALEGGSKVTINADTVFTFTRSSDKSGEPQNVFSCAVGQISYKFNRMTQEPVIATPSAVCGIRGTDFTVTTGADGSSLFVVTEGEVEVESMGKRVSLTLDEGVEVANGKVPGEKFPVLNGSLDYSKWLERAEETAMADPEKTVKDLTDRLVYYIAEMDRYHALWLRGMEEIKTLREQVKKYQDEEKDAEADDLAKNKLIPFIKEVAGYSINVRYYSLSSLSLRRYTLGSMYVKLRAAHFKEGSQAFDDFLKAYNTFLNDYYEICQDPFLVDADI